MTKSQNTKNEHNCIKQNEKSFTQKDLSLTELWQKGELPSGFYYVKNEFNNIFPSDYSESYDSINDAVIKDFFTEISEIKEVIEAVPSYDELKASEKYIKSLEEKIKIYERIDKQHTNDSIAYNELAEEKEKLKDLLKECESSIQYYQETYGVMDLDTYTLLAKLKELDK